MGLGLALLIFFVPTLAAADGPASELPRIRWDRPVWCMDDPAHKRIRVQCTRPNEEGEKVCLYAPDCQIGRRATSCQALRRAKTCIRVRQTYADLVQAGYRFTRAVAAAPPGWMRDARGRVFQYNFDLGRRIWIGARWPFAHGPEDRMELGRVGLESGARIEVLTRKERTRYRFHALVSEVMLNPLSVDATLFMLDSSHESNTPLMRITTFLGDPERHDLYMNVGWFGEFGTVHHTPRGSTDETVVRIVALGPTWDLWHDADMTSFFRLRFGAALEDLYLRREGVGNRVAVTPVVALETDITFDRDGFHHLQASTTYEAPFVWEQDGDAPATHRHRFLSEVAYEVILLAVNDQPLTLRATVGGGYRDDLADAARGWELTAGVGLRMSLWVPPRDLRALDRARQRLGLEPAADGGSAL